MSILVRYLNLRVSGLLCHVWACQNWIHKFIWKFYLSSFFSLFLLSFLSNSSRLICPRVNAHRIGKFISVRSYRFLPFVHLSTWVRVVQIRLKSKSWKNRKMNSWILSRTVDYSLTQLSASSFDLLRTCFSFFLFCSTEPQMVHAFSPVHSKLISHMCVSLQIYRLCLYLQTSKNGWKFWGR